MSVSEYSSGGSPGDELGADPDDISLSTEEVDLTAAGDDDSAVAENNAGPAGNWLKRPSTTTAAAFACALPRAGTPWKRSTPGLRWLSGTA